MNAPAKILQFPTLHRTPTEQERRNRARLAQWESRKAQLAMHYSCGPDELFRLPRWERLGINHTLQRVEDGVYRPINICRLHLGSL